MCRADYWPLSLVLCNHGESSKSAHSQGIARYACARVWTQGGALHTIEMREADAATAARNFNLSAASEKIFLHVGNALDIIPTLDEAWDMVFIDADKTAYIDYYQMLLPKLRKNALVVVDNVLFHGQVLEEPILGKNAVAIDAFNKLVMNDQLCDNVLLTVRDGLMLILKN